MTSIQASPEVAELRQPIPEGAVYLARPGPKVPRDPGLIAFLAECSRDDLLALPDDEQALFWQWCSTSKHAAPLNDFAPSKRGGTGECRTCGAARMRGRSALFTPEQRADKVRRVREWAQANPEKRRDLDLKKYGITAVEYDAMLEEQNGVCKACGEPESRRGRDGEPVALHLDHCHESGRVRGLLCHRCNMALGYARESVKVLMGLINYIEGWPA